MRFTKVDEVPKKKAYHKLKDDLERFMQSGMKIVRIDFHEGEYKSATIAANCLRIAVKRHGFNGIKVILRGVNVYLENNMRDAERGSEQSGPLNFSIHARIILYVGVYCLSGGGDGKLYVLA